MPTVLLAVTGLSPGIVTETIWALAAEVPRVVPARVVFLTTTVGREILRERLFTPRADYGGVSVWQALRKAVGAGAGELMADEPCIITRANPVTGQTEPLVDIQTPEENELAADFILEETRKIVENPDLQLVCSIGGGRKTMGTLLYAAVSLIGRETDRVTHVLVSAPYEMPEFYFPAQPSGPLADRSGNLWDPAEAKLQLTDVPFVPLRNRFREMGTMPGNFSGLVQKFSRQMKADATRRVPQLELRPDQGCLVVDGQTVALRTKAMQVLSFLLTQQDQYHFQEMTQQDLADELAEWLLGRGFSKSEAAKFNEDQVRHELSHIRKQLATSNAAWQLPKRTLALPDFELQSPIKTCFEV